MPKIDETVIGFAVYEDATEYIGISEVTLPEISNITEEISGAGIGGKIESVILGAIEAMSLTLNFRTVTNNAIKLHEPRQHNIDLRAAQQQKDTVKGTTEVTDSIRRLFNLLRDTFLFLANFPPNRIRFLPSNS